MSTIHSTRNRRVNTLFVRGESGSSLVVVMIMALVMLISAMAIMELGVQDAALAMRDARASQAFYNAEAGLERGEAWLMAQTDLPTDPVSPFGETAESFGDGLYLVEIDPDDSSGRMIYTVTSYATVAGRSRALEVDCTPSAFTDYLYYTNRDIGPSTPGYFRSGEIIDGPIHVDDEIAIWGDPTFLGPVESTESTILYHNDWSPVSLSAFSNPPFDEPNFQGGIELGAPTFPWLTGNDLDTIEDVAGITSTAAWAHDIVFGRDPGTGPMLGWVSLSKAGMGSWNDYDLSSFNGIIYVAGNCNVSGIIDGQATLASNGTIFIVDDLLYADSDANGPRPGCDDLLGLLSGCKVVVADNVANQSDCEIHGHMIAIENEASVVEHYDMGAPRGMLTLYGGIAQDKWGPVGTGYYDAYDVFHVLTGYTRDFHYDWRLRTMLPPGYEYIVFTQGALERLAWREIAPVTLTGG